MVFDDVEEEDDEEDRELLPDELASIRVSNSRTARRSPSSSRLAGGPAFHPGRGTMSRIMGVPPVIPPPL